MYGIAGPDVMQEWVRIGNDFPVRDAGIGIFGNHLVLPDPMDPIILGAVDLSRES
jgi:hypothetical protein